MRHARSRQTIARRLLLASGVAASLLAAACQSNDQKPAGEAEAQGWAGAPLDADPEQVAAGKEIAERECAQCHAVDRTSKSPNETAPPLRDVLAINDADNLAYRFIEAMRVGHDDMPLFDFDVRSADSLIAYIASISQ